MNGHVAAIDCGTNSLRLLIADRAQTDLLRRTEIVRLGQGVERTGRLAPEALDRTRRVLAEYAALVRAHGVDRLRMVATSATRDAANRGDFVAMVHDVLGIEPEVISGDEEADLSFAGAVNGLPGLHGRVLVADIGGGSTELIVGSPGTDGPLSTRSVDVGSVRLTERHLHGDPPTRAQIVSTEADVRDAIDLARIGVPLREASTVIGVAGTVTTLAALALGLGRYDSARVHGARIPADHVRAVTGRLLTMTRAERAALPAMHRGRADVICAGALILRTLLDEMHAAELVVSEHDILDGIVLRLLPG